ncbi:amidohydrolase [Nonomuraea sp. MG754425]|uniref:amidohydrolase family protein n=1 Tax=Nonomuraea sp. MG754425 TaxID=2570319 RepID=UPI001F1FAD73|nr:amidohydrolase family protein [Nonomuraea sp. MG754425]MCF6470628.1 amidohydrolase [Nonomuraea sp. MG754425]
MTVTQIHERVPAPALVPVRVVDNDVHPVPKNGQFLDHIPEPYRSRYFMRQRFGETITYDAPDYDEAKAMRMDAFPADGGFPGSDPEMAFQHVIMEAGCDIAILEPGSPEDIRPEIATARAIATNNWLDAQWLSGQGNWHGRWRGSICVAIEDPEGSAREIERWAGHPYMGQILLHAEPRPSWGHPKYDPVWAAATRHDITVACHLGRGAFDNHPRPPVGWPSYNHDFMVTYSLLAANQVMSLIFDGVFERFPTLRIVLVEHAFNWILPLMWRMDAIYAARGGDVPHVKRKPSEYVYDHIFFSTQPLDYPEDKLELTRSLELMRADKLLLFSSDYPHWTYDDPTWVLKHIPEDMRDAIMFKNGIELYKLPESVPPIEGQRRVF